MSRIDEAMRRLGQVGPRPVEPAGEPQAALASPPDTARDSAAASPWDFEAAPGDTERRVEPAQGATVVPPPDIPAEVAALRPNVQSEKLVVGATSSIPVEQYRRLAAALHHAQAERGLRVVMITSALPREGKTLSAINLGLTLSESYRRRVLLIDADLRKPSLHDVFGVANASGLSDGLRQADERKLPVVQVSPTLTVLPAGRPEADPMHMLSSARMRRVLEEAGQNFDWVIVDTPPVALLPDANLLAAMVDVAILVIQAGVTPHAAVQRAIDMVGRERILGVVLNGVDGSGAHHHYGYDGKYGYGQFPARP